MKHQLSIIVAMGKNNQIGLEGKIPWHLPQELAHFKKITEHHHILMGRKTFDSLGRLLPNRQHIVISNSPKIANSNEQLEYWPALTHRLHDLPPAKKIYVIGGAQIYQQALKLDLCNELHISRVDYDGSADAFFPVIDLNKWKLLNQENKEHFVYELWGKK